MSLLEKSAAAADRSFTARGSAGRFAHEARYLKYPDTDDQLHAGRIKRM
jgi:hypothetical protein